MENTENMEKEISFEFLWSVLKKGIVWIAVVSVLLAAFAGLFTHFFMHETYSATSGYFVNNSSAGADYTSSALTGAATQIATDCLTLVKSTEIVKHAVEVGELDKLLDCTKSEAIEIVKKMTNSYKPDVNAGIFYVTVSNADATVAFKVSVAMQDAVVTCVGDEIFSNFGNEQNDFLHVIQSVDNSDDVLTSTPSVVTNALIAFIVGAVLTYVVLFVKTILDKTVRDESTIKENFAYPVLSSVPSWNPGKNSSRKQLNLMKKNSEDALRVYNNQVLSSETPFAITEAFNNLRTAVSYSVSADKSSVFAVTSEFAGAGKSVISTNLAIAFSDLGKRVLLVEGDMRRPTFDKIFGVKAERGFVDLLTDSQSTVEDCSIKYNDNLTIIQAGYCAPNPSTLLSSTRMQELVAAWRDEYDIVIIDTPPVTSVADARIISDLVTGYIIVARSNYSDVREIKNAISLLSDVQGQILGFVVNDCSLKGNKYGYRYYYYSNADK
ncbi:MAG: polysaccharide biosynthesis tyrosine autokinase [Clostridia bacterium]|nr:polysaccharide biosynthesis tyrosine autokinase [Clostridia bacterium]